ncbi:MAG: hypothetical protein PVG06_08780 [Desulfobacterales bacterium]
MPEFAVNLVALQGCFCNAALFDHLLELRIGECMRCGRREYQSLEKINKQQPSQKRPNQSAPVKWFFTDGRLMVSFIRISEYFKR